VHLGVARQTLYDWGTEDSERYHPEFSDILEQLMAAQRTHSGAKRPVVNGPLAVDPTPLHMRQGMKVRETFGFGVMIFTVAI